MTTRVTMQVNGIERGMDIKPTETLLETLRREERLYGVREGCGIGMCGACTVLVDDQPMSSCLALTCLCDGRSITTIEGLAPPDGELHPIQQAFLDCNAFQCSYCTPGFILMAKALLDENGTPSTEEIRAYLAGNSVSMRQLPQDRGGCHRGRPPPGRRGGTDAREDIGSRLVRTDGARRFGGHEADGPQSSISRPGVAVELCDRLAASATALLVIDMQNDYLDESGALARAGLPLDHVRDIVPAVWELIFAARSAGVRVVFTRNWHTPETDTPAWVQGFAKTAGAAGRAGLAGTWGADWYAGIEPEADEIVISKSRYDAFLRTDLDARLRELGITSVAMCGTATNVCVELTARGAHMRDYHTVLVSDACAASDQQLHEAAIKNVARHFGAVAAVEQVLECWQSAMPVSGRARLPVSAANESPGSAPSSAPRRSR